MPCKEYDIYEVAIKDTIRIKFTPQIRTETGWENVTPVSTSAQLEEFAGIPIQTLTVLPLPDDEYAVDFYADDSIFDTAPDEPKIEANMEFYVAFYWTYTSNGNTIKKGKRATVKVVEVE